jgi:hypothetical protein
MGAARGGLPKDQRARGDSHHTRRRLALAALVAVLAIICGGARTTSPALAAGEPFRTGDLFQSGGGYIRHINPTFWDIGSWTPADGEGPTSMAFDADGNLYASVIAGGVVVITSEGFYGGLVVEDEDAGALAVDSDGNIFVAVPSATIRKYDPGGSLVDSYTVATGSGSTQATSLAIAADDCTLFYTNDDTVVRRYKRLHGNAAQQPRKRHHDGAGGAPHPGRRRPRERRGRHSPLRRELWRRDRDLRHAE